MDVAQTKKVNIVKHADTSEGRKYGYIAQNSPRKIPGHRSCGFASAPPYSGLQGVVSFRNSLHQCPNARDGNPNAKNGWYDSKDLGHVSVVGNIAEHTLHHPDVTIQHTGDTST